MTAYYPFSEETKNRFKITRTSPFGIRGGKLHDGEDWAPSVNKLDKIEIIASADGVLSTGIDNFGALWTYIAGDDGRGYLSAHHREFIKKKGRVKAGEVIALMGTTGKSTGVHTHFEVRADKDNSKSSVNPTNTAKVIFYDQNNMTKETIAEATKWAELVKTKFGIDLFEGVADAVSLSEVQVILYKFTEYLHKTKHDD